MVAVYRSRSDVEDLPTFNAPSAAQRCRASRNPLSGIVFCRYEDGTAILPSGLRSHSTYMGHRVVSSAAANVVCSMRMHDRNYVV